MTDTEILDVVAAHVAGKKIQCKPKYPMASHVNMDWANCNPYWNFDQFIYRVAPAPTEELCPCCGKPRKEEFWIEKIREIIKCGS